MTVAAVAAVAATAAASTAAASGGGVDVSPCHSGAAEEYSVSALVVQGTHGEALGVVLDL